MDARAADSRQPERRERAYFTTWCPAGTPLATLVAVEGRRWSIEEAFETAKTELGHAHNETPLLAWMASARQPGDAGLRPAGGDPPSRQRAAPKKPSPAETARPLIRWSVQEIRRLAMRLAQTSHPARPCHRMVALATSASGGSAPSAPQTPCPQRKTTATSAGRPIKQTPNQNVLKRNCMLESVIA